MSQKKQKSPKNFSDFGSFASNFESNFFWGSWVVFFSIIQHQGGLEPTDMDQSFFPTQGTEKQREGPRSRAQRCVGVGLVWDDGMVVTKMGWDDGVLTQLASCDFWGW